MPLERIAKGATKAGWFAFRVRRRVQAELKHLRIRRDDRRAAKTPRSLPATAVLPWSPLAAVPGHADALPWADGRPRGDDLSVPILAHRFKILSPDTRDMSRDDPPRLAAIAALAPDLPREAVQRYQPIDWHRDFGSGYRWDPGQFYLDVAVAPVPGAEIKAPRELSRFQHVGALATGNLEAGGIEFLLEVADWIVDNPVRRGVNWACAMDVALRAVNWAWGLRLFEPVALNYPQTLRVVTQSLGDHARHVYENLEYYADLTTNHYLANVAGLLYIGATCPELEDSDLWLHFGLQELVSEMQRQVYEDGVSQEASTHYHRLVADLFTSCAALAERLPQARRERLATLDVRRGYVEPGLRSLRESGVDLGAAGRLLPLDFYIRLGRMAECTAALTKPNGLVPQVGDNDSARAHFLMPQAGDDFRDHAHLPATVGHLLARGDLTQAGRRAMDEAMLVAGGLEGVAVTEGRTWSGRSLLLPAGGIAVRREPQAWLAVTCGTNGQRGRGGHGHNDKNGFELNVGGLDVVVDGGCPAYTSAPAVRNRYRSTAAHSTVAIDGQEQDEWPEGAAGLFRLPEKSHPRIILEGDVVVGRHDGYGCVHERRFSLSPDALVIDDMLDDLRRRHLNFNLDPGVEVDDLATTDEGVRCRLRLTDGRLVECSILGATDLRVQAGAFGIGYGEPIPNLCLSATMTGQAARTEFRWAA